MKNKRVHFIGIGGVSQSKLARILQSFGSVVSGSDKEDGPETHALRAQGIQVFVPHDEKCVLNADLVVYNGAISDDNAELKKARQLSIPIIKRSECLSQIAGLYKECVAICGSHGKTTTTSVLAYALSGLSPQMHIGGNLIGVPFEVSPKKDLFVSEACEFQKSFLDMSPDYAVMLNIDADHLDCYKDIDEIEAAFLQFAKQTKKVLIYNNEDARVRRVADSVDCRKIAFGREGDVQARRIRLNKNGIKFKLYYKKKFECHVEARLFGKHNVLNLLAAAAVSLVLGQKSFCKNISDFAGVERRMQFLGRLGSSIIIHDYAHHPQEIAATIKAVKQHFRRPVVAVFEPHTYSRTKALWNDFTQCFKGAKCVFMLPIYSAREKSLPGITSSALAAETPKCIFVRGKDDLSKYLKKFNKHIILVMGAGGVVRLAHKLI